MGFHIYLQYDIYQYFIVDFGLGYLYGLNIIIINLLFWDYISIIIII